MSNLIFTISRSYGSGGSIIGRALAEALGCEYYDKDLIKLASLDSGIDEGLFGKADEFVKKGLFKSSSIYKGELIPPSSAEFSSEDNLFNYQAKIIKSLASEKSCVIIGRCADFVLRESGHRLVSVFISAPDEFCVKTLYDTFAFDEKESRRRIERVNRARGDYYKYYTGQDWLNAPGYDLCLDSSRMPFEESAQLIIDYARHRFGTL